MVLEMFCSFSRKFIVAFPLIVALSFVRALDAQGHTETGTNFGDQRSYEI